MLMCVHVCAPMHSVCASVHVHVCTDAMCVYVCVCALMHSVCASVPVHVCVR